MINKDTKIFASFSKNPGNNGCIFFNEKFKENNLDAIYKSFYSDNLMDSINSAKHLGFVGFALSSPFKTEILHYLDFYDDDVRKIGAANTVLIRDKKLYGYNTDHLGVYNFFKNKKIEHINLIGNGGFGKSAIYAFLNLDMTISYVDRNNISKIDDVDNQYFFNATPIEVISQKNHVFDGRPFTDVGLEIFKHQAEAQYNLYKNLYDEL